MLKFLLGMIVGSTLSFLTYAFIYGASKCESDDVLYVDDDDLFNRDKKE